jgi:hypothetical protein
MFIITNNMAMQPILITSMDDFDNIHKIMNCCKTLINFKGTNIFKKICIHDYKTYLETNQEYQQQYQQIISIINNQYPNVNSKYRQFIIDEALQIFEQKTKKYIDNYEQFFNDCHYGNFNRINKNIDKVDNHMINNGFMVACLSNNLDTIKYISTLYKKYKHLNPVVNFEFFTLLIRYFLDWEGLSEVETDKRLKILVCTISQYGCCIDINKPSFVTKKIYL